MEMIQSRNQTSHTYNEEVADGISGKVIKEYLPAFLTFRNPMEGLLSGKQGTNRQISLVFRDVIAFL